MKLNFHKYSTLILLLLFLWSGCDKDNEVKVNTIQFENVEIEGLVLEVDEEVQVLVNTFPKNASRAGITYKSSDENIFTVTAKGVIIGHNVGEAELLIKTQDGSYLSDTRPITVLPKTVPVESIEILGLEEGYLILLLDHQHKILLDLMPENANTPVAYHSSNPDIFTVNEQGYATGLIADGEAELTVTSTRDPGISISCTVKVLEHLPIRDIILPDGDISLKNLGDQYDLGAQIILVPSASPKENLVYTSSNEEVASVNPAGVITAKGRGSAVITISTSDGTDIEKTVDIEVDAELHYDGWSVTASSYNASQGTPGAILVDGASPFWHSKWEGGNEPLPHWLLIDMAEERLITDVLVERRWTNTDTRKVTVEISRDGSNFTQVDILDWGGSPVSDFARFATFAKQNARYVRLTVTESNRSPFASINRVRVYGALE